ncbi:MAG: VrrA/YqfQ family protein [Bacilli bacterium]|nr:VrrA/YqfQ family protein [Bacilli bacterium]MDD4283091.1 VrrA/YqfQ family protein [Bacilli bacterium]MDD4719061.1 VrrA/YqfQ family protein [Bacilli bacterium]
MNYYNIPNMNYARGGLFSSLFRNGINWSSLLNNTQQTLNLVNQVVPIVKQVPPIYRNAKTMFKVMNEFKRVDTPKSIGTSTANSEQSNNTNQEKYQENVNYSYQNGPTFFL